jgi:hypothetical protein
VRLLRAFPDLLAVGRERTRELYAVTAKLELIASQPLRADELVRCGDARWYALSAGTAGTSGFRVLVSAGRRAAELRPCDRP